MMQLKQSNRRIEICKICFKPIEKNTFHSLLCKGPTICHNCLLAFGPEMKTFWIDDIECLHLYFYNSKVQEVLYQFKGCKDYELYSVFIEYYLPYLNIKFNGYEVIPAPSSEESDLERGFNHVEEMFSKLHLKMSKIIHKTGKRKQADLTTKQREKIANYLKIEDVDLSGKKILLVDDVYTTGSTIRAMIKLAKNKGAKKIKVLLMSKTIDLEKR